MFVHISNFCLVLPYIYYNNVFRAFMDLNRDSSMFIRYNMAVFKRGDVDLHIDTNFSVINIVEKREGNTLFIIFPIRLILSMHGCHGNDIS